MDYFASVSNGFLGSYQPESSGFAC